MSEEEMSIYEESVERLLAHGAIEETRPKYYRVTKAYKKKFNENLRFLKEEHPKMDRDERHYSALIITVGEMFHPDSFSTIDAYVLALIDYYVGYSWDEIKREIKREAEA